jgi:hypothetical protein
MTNYNKTGKLTKYLCLWAMKGMYSKLSKSSEISRFENRFSENVIEIAAVTGALGIGASKGGDNILWTASIDLIAWKEKTYITMKRLEKKTYDWHGWLMMQLVISDKRDVIC